MAQPLAHGWPSTRRRTRSGTEPARLRGLERLVVGSAPAFSVPTRSDMDVGNHLALRDLDPSAQAGEFDKLPMVIGRVWWRSQVRAALAAWLQRRWTRRLLSSWARFKRIWIFGRLVRIARARASRSQMVADSHRDSGSAVGLGADDARRPLPESFAMDGLDLLGSDDRFVSQHTPVESWRQI
jgi:hypothetical protein